MKNIDICRLVEIAEKRTGKDISYAPDYAEPGYSTPERGILFANWNPSCGYSGTAKAEQRRDAICKLARIAEHFGYECEWSDEWTTCQECGKAVRTSPDSYHWTPAYRILNECELICLGCLDPEEYLLSIEDDCDKACPPEWNPEDHGYIKFNGDFETGYHPGQNDSPSQILKKMHELGLSRVVFKIAEQSQFYVVWQAYHRAEENS